MTALRSPGELGTRAINSASNFCDCKTFCRAHRLRFGPVRQTQVYFGPFDLVRQLPRELH